MIRVSPLLLAAMLVVGSHVSANQAADSRISDKAAAHEAKLDKIRDHKPAEFARIRRKSTFLAEALLGSLGYYNDRFDGVLDKRTEIALRAYEKNRGLPVTGDPLSFETFERVKADILALDYQRVRLPSFSLIRDLWHTGHVSAEGTWTVMGEGEKVANPKQTSHIACYRDWGYCIEAKAILSEGKLSLAILSEGKLSLTSEIYQIERWDEYEVVTKPLEYACTRTVLRLNRVQKSVTAIRSMTSSNCKKLDQDEDFLVLKGMSDVMRPIYDRRQRTSWQLMQIAPELRDLLDDETPLSE